MIVKRLWHLILALGILAIAYPIQAQSDDWMILSAAYSPKGSMIALSGTQGRLEIRDAKNQQTLFSITVSNAKYIASLAWSPDSKRIVGVTQGTFINVWNINDPAHTQGELLASLVGFRGYIGDLIWTPDGGMIIGASANDSDVRNFKGWDTNNYQLQFESTGPNYVNSVSWSPDNNRVAIAAAGGFGITDPTDIMSGKIDNVTRLSQYPTLSTHWSRTSRYLASVSDDSTSTIRVYDVIAGTSVKFPDNILLGGVLFAWSPNDKFLATFGIHIDDGTVKIWDPTTGDLLSSRKTNYVIPASALDWSPDGNYLAYPSDPSTLAITPPFTGSDLNSRVSVCVSDTKLRSSLKQQIDMNAWDSFISAIETQTASSISMSCKSQLLEMVHIIKATHQDN